jgi:adenylate cyclase
MRAPRFQFIPRRRIRLLALTFTAAVVAGLLAFSGVMGTSLGQDAENRSLDWRFQERGTLPADKDIVIVGIDNDSDAALNRRFPYPRDFHAIATDTLAKAGAKAIVFDIQFLEPAADTSEVPGEEQDRAFVEQLALTDRDVLATAAEAEHTPMPFRGVELEGIGDPLEVAGSVVATSRQDATADGVKRSFVPFSDLETGQMPALSLAALAVAENKSPKFFLGEYPGQVQINFRGPRSDTRTDGKGFKYYSYADLVLEGADTSWAKDKIVFIGATSEVLQDVHETPYRGTRQMPGVEIHAHALQTLRHRDWIEPQSERGATIAAVLMVLAVWLAMAFTPLWAGALLGVALPVGYVYLAQRAFEQSNDAWQLVPVLAAGGAAFLTTLLGLALSALRDRRKVTSMFSRYVSPDVVRELIDVHEEIMVGGERREISVLFSDIRGFTTMSEGLDPSELVEQLNEYFEEMIEAIQLERGTFDKFIGDGLMAIFGAPLEQPDHAESACRAALDMIERLELLNADRRERGLGILEIGIGIHTGEAVVGNIGSPSLRVDYTAIGDTVNLASRLESNTKTTGARILVSKQTAAAASSMTYVPKGSITVKGRASATEVFELVGDAETAAGQQKSSRPLDTDGQAA